MKIATEKDYSDARSSFLYATGDASAISNYIHKLTCRMLPDDEVIRMAENYRNRR
jgi:hypothetical protein